MPTPEAYKQLLSEYNDLKRKAYRVLMAYEAQESMEAHDDLWELAGDYEPTEAEQGLIPIPDGYAEQ